MTNEADQQRNRAETSTDAMETEARLAMEFPRHNWLAKHIMKEQKLKEEVQLSTNDESNCFTLNTSSSASSSVPGLAENTSENDNSKSESISPPKASAFETQHNMVGIVKPVQYFIDTASPEKKRSFSTNKDKKYKDQLPFLQDSSKDLVVTQDTDKEIAAFSKLKEDTDKSIINKDFTVIVAPASRSGIALDLSFKSKDNETDFALDLSKKNNPETNLFHEKNDASTNEAVQTQNSDSERFSAPSKTKTDSPIEQKPFVVITSVKSLSNKCNFETNNDYLRPQQEKLNSANSDQKNSKDFCWSDDSNHLGKRHNDDKLKIQQPLKSKCQLIETNGNAQATFLKVRSSSLSTKNDESPKSTTRPQCQSFLHTGCEKNTSTRSASTSSAISDQKLEPKYTRKTPTIDIDMIEDDIPIIRPRVYSTTTSSSNISLAHKTTSATKSANRSNYFVSSHSTHQAKRFPSYNLNAPTRNHFVKENQYFAMEKAVTELAKNNQMTLENKSNLIEKPSFNSYSSSMLNISNHSHQTPSFEGSNVIKSDYKLQSKAISSTKNTLTLEYSRRDAPAGIRFPGVRPDTIFNRSSVQLAQRQDLLTTQQACQTPSQRVILPGSSNYRSPAVLPRLNLPHTAIAELQFPYHKSTKFLKNQEQESLYPVKPRPISKSQPSFCNAASQLHHNLQRFPPRRISIGGVENVSLSSSLLQHDNCKPIARLPLYNNDHSRISQTRSLCGQPRVVDGRPINQPKIPINTSVFPREKCSYPTLPRLLNAPNINMLSARETKNFAAQIQVQKLELENQIHNLKALEKKIYSTSPFYSQNHTGVQESALQKQQKHFFPVMEKRKMNNVSLVQDIPVPNKQPRQMPVFLQGSTMLSSAESFSLLSQKNAGRLDEKCIHCKAKAFFVCSGCRSVWYCSKQCQLDDWPKHNTMCS